MDKKSGGKKSEGKKWDKNMGENGGLKKLLCKKNTKSEGKKKWVKKKSLKNIKKKFKESWGCGGGGGGFCTIINMKGILFRKKNGILFNPKKKNYF